MVDSKQAIELSAINGIKLETTPNFYGAYKGFAQGQYQAMAYDMAVMKSLTLRYNDTTNVIVPYESESNKNAYNVFIVHKDNQELLQTLNSGLAKLKQNGKLDEIRKKYIGE